MVLDRKLLTVPLLAGLNTKEDPFQVPLSDLLELENAVFDTPGLLKKRNGFTSLPFDLVSGKINEGKALATYNDELLMFTGQNAVSYSSALQRWLDKGTAVSVICQKDQLLANANSQYLGTGLLLGNYEIYSYVDWDVGTQNTSVKYTIIDHISKVRIIDNQVVDNAGLQPQVIEFGGLAYVFYTVTTVTNTDLKYKVFNPASPFTLTAAVSLVDDVNSLSPNYDLTVGGGFLRLVYCEDDGANARYQTYTAITAPPIFNFAWTGASTGVAISMDDDGNTWIISDSKVHVYSDSSGQLAETHVNNMENINRIAICPNAQGVQVFWEINSDELYNDGNYSVRSASFRLSGTSVSITGLGDFKRGVGLYTKPFLINGIRYIILQRTSDLQSCYFLVDQNKNIIARLQYGQGASFVEPKYKTLCQPIVDGGIAIFPTVNLGFQNVLNGLSRFSVDFDSNNSFIGYSAAGTFNIVGGIVQSYDNTRFVENNFLLYPEGITAELVEGSGGLAAGSYLYKVVYTALNNNNVPEYSKTSVALRVVLPTAGDVLITIPTLRITQRNQVVIEVYRTVAGQSTLYYKVGEVLNNPTIDRLTILDSTLNSNLISQLPLYTTGGILENIAPTNCNLMVVYNNRVFIAGLEVSNQIAYSKLLQTGYALEFAEENVINCTPLDDNITGLAVLENSLIIFKNNSIYAISGQGPNNFGQLDDFSDVQRIPSDVGCVSSNSIHQTEEGLFFQSKKGIYLLSRGLEVTYIGKNVERYNNLPVTSCRLVESKNQLRFTTPEVVLVYDTLVKKWTTFTNLGDIVDSEVWNSNYIVLTSKGIVKQEMADLFKDDGFYVPIKLSTSWIKMNDLEGYGRTYNVFFLGNNYSRHNIVVNVAYDYQPFDSYHRVIDSDDLKRGGTNYGDGNYGDDVYGGRYYGYEGRLAMKKQKCKAIKITFQDQANGDNSGEGFSLSGFVFEIGVEQGGYRFRKNSTFGTES